MLLRGEGGDPIQENPAEVLGALYQYNRSDEINDFVVNNGLGHLFIEFFNVRYKDTQKQLKPFLQAVVTRAGFPHIDAFLNSRGEGSKAYILGLGEEKMIDGKSNGVSELGNRLRSVIKALRQQPPQAGGGGGQPPQAGGGGGESTNLIYLSYFMSFSFHFCANIILIHFGYFVKSPVDRNEKNPFLRWPIQTC